MGLDVFVCGESGSGKSASMRNCQPERFGVINVSKKPLPFKSRLKVLSTDSYDVIKKALRKAEARSIVIDDSQYLMVNAFMRRSNERGYDKFTEIAYNHWDLIRFVCDELPADKIVYFMSHIERDQNGFEKVKTIGRMLDQYITLEGMSSIVLKTQTEDGKYYFRTHNSGSDTVKSPIGMFESDTIDNDLQLVDDIIRNYYGDAMTDAAQKEDE